MTDDTPRATTRRTDEKPTDRQPGLVAVPDDPEAPEEVTFLPEGADDERLATAWITADAEDVVALADWR